MPGVARAIVSDIKLDKHTHSTPVITRGLAKSRTSEQSTSMPIQFEYTGRLSNAFGFNSRGGCIGAYDAKPLVELEMTRLSAKIRRKPLWWTKFRDPEVLAKWRIEALAQADQMEESHVDYVLKELDGYANLRDEESGAEVSCHDGIWQSDTLIPASLKERLVAGVSRLENVPEAEKDWCPQSNRQVLDLVDPSLYPIVYGRTLSYLEDSDDRGPANLGTHFQAPMESWQWYGHPREYAYYVSGQFQWLPTDFKVSADGTSAKSDGYINNLHPIEHAELHKTIEDLVAAYIPLFERALTDSITVNRAVPGRTNNRYRYKEDFNLEEPYIYDFSDIDLYEMKRDEWQMNRPIILPSVSAKGYELGHREARLARYVLGGKTIQVIVKPANIHLTPEKPSYAGGSWHIEGMKNEDIAVSGIYYYDEENITESRLAFRTAVIGPQKYVPGDHIGCIRVWGIGRDDPCLNNLGSVVTSQDRCVAFPNTYQHRVCPFELVDKTKPGHCKIVTLFLVDPADRRPSTKSVPPQQKDWRIAAMHSNPVLSAKFAPEIMSIIGSLSNDVMTREEAEEYRPELIDERTEFVLMNDEEWFSVPFSLREDEP